MIPNEVLELARGPKIGRLATRDAELIPTIHHLCGVQLNEEGTVATVFTVESQLGALEDSFEAKHQMAFGFSAQGNLCYQFKGRAVALREPSAEEVEWAKGQQEPIVQYLESQGLPEDPTRAYAVRKPTHVVTLEVDFVFNQTPGPNAGKMIYSRGEA